jgi:Na+/H+ antiporter NhaD/arsenite permease-like protein
MMTTAVYFAWKRTRGDTGWVAHAIKWTGVALLVGYPLLAIAYLTDEFGAIVEPIFFIAFSVMVFIELFEPSKRRVTPR